MRSSSASARSALLLCWRLHSLTATITIFLEHAFGREVLAPPPPTSVQPARLVQERAGQRRPRRHQRRASTRDSGAIAGPWLPLQVGGLPQAGFQMIHQPPCFLDLEVPALDRRFAGHPQALQEQFRAVLHRLQHLGVGVPAHHVIHLVAPSW